MNRSRTGALLWLLMAAGCDANDNTPVAIAPPPLVLDAPTIVAGHPSDIVVRGANAGDRVYLLRSSETQPDGWCPPQVAPACIDLARPVEVVTSVVADSSGTAVFSFTLPAGMETTPVGLQAGVLGTAGAELSNALDTVIHARRSDVDGDGLQALDEVQAYGTNPNLLDSDGGGDADGVEVAYGTDPTVAGDDLGTVADAAGVEHPGQVVGTPNLDDDNSNNRTDWSDGRFGTDDDLIEFAIRPSSNGPAAQVASIELELTGDVGNIKIWNNGSVLLQSGQRTASIPWQSAEITLEAEFAELLQQGTIEVTEVLDNGFELASSEIELLSSPMILNHHLQPAESVWMVSVNSFFTGSNQDMVSGYRNVLGNDFTAVSGGQYDDDVWLQDEVEFATITSPTTRSDLVIDSIRDRGLAPFANDWFDRPDDVIETWGRGNANSQDSFGNLEVSPPVTVDGVEYPLGRIYYGAFGSNFGPHPNLENVLSDQLVQTPFEIDTRWLCVGHVDEFMSFVPDSTSPKGFRLIYADTRSGYDLLDSMSNSNLPQYGDFWTGHGYSNVASMRNDNGLRNYNDDLQVMELDPILDQLREELGLVDDDIILLPSIFEPVSGCSNTGAALIPGMVNLIVANMENEPAHIFMADPFLRSNVNNQGSDDMIDEVESLMPAELELHYLDDWDVYHLGLGEVHCGTNVVRTPVDGWWNEIQHLLGVQ